MVTNSKESIELKIKQFNELFSKEVQKLDLFYDSVTQKANVLMGAD